MQKAVIHFSISKTEVKKFSEAEELTGKLRQQDEENKLMHSVLENDKEIIDEGKIIKEAINRGLSSFTADLMFEQLVKNYSMARNLFGESLIRLLTDYDPSYIEKNINIPEFQRELKKKIGGNIERLKENKFIDREGFIADKGIKLASLVLYAEELDNMAAKGFLGEKIHKKASCYGDKEDAKQYKKGDRYQDLAIKKSLKLSIRRGHKRLVEEDLKTFERKSKGSIAIIYALDASGSMKGRKIDICKKAGVALAFKAIDERDKVGLIVFGSDIKEEVRPTNDFRLLLEKITQIRASKETNFVSTLKKAIELFPSADMTKHLILLTDAMPTVGENPEKDSLEAVSLARANGITISLVGIQLDEEGRKLAEKIASLGEGRLYVVKDLEKVDKIVLEDYYSVV